ncbi:MAG TPA: ABC transporter substrate-binding protein, partial [Opitutales bacterium]|nr:ABC transporter substrate-binding protein [Opitutales bacterium]
MFKLSFIARTKWPAWLLRVAMLALLANLALGADTPPLDHVVLQLKWKHQFQFAGYYAAIEQGYYRAAGLDVKLVEGSPDHDPTGEVLDG